MQLLATKEGKQIWFHELSRPYRIERPFPDEFYVCILFANDETITEQEQTVLSEQLVRTDCRFAVCAGHKCSSWDTSIDTAYISMDPEQREETFVMTSWHDQESVEDVVFFGLQCTLERDYNRYLVLNVGSRPDLREEVLKAIQSVWHGEA